jgi:hypothetical protein
MTTADIVYDETEEQRVEGWRSEVLERAGYDGPSAAVLARRRDVDLHRAVELVQHGCPPAIALKILL